MKPTVEMGAMTLVLLVKYYKSQMIALLLKNGVTVPSRASDQQIAMLMANLLKVSKSFFIDLNNFIQNPKVLQVLAGGIKENAQFFRMSGNAQYFRMSGNRFMNSTGGEDGFTDTGEPAPTDTNPDKSGFWKDLNFGDLFTKVLDGFSKYDKNLTDRAIAEAKAKLGRNLTPIEIAEIEKEQGKENGKDEDPDKGMSVTTIVVLSLVGVAVLGTIIYFVARPKK